MTDRWLTNMRAPERHAKLTGVATGDAGPMWPLLLAFIVGCLGFGASVQLFVWSLR